jgi:hypothetical protein
LTVQGRDAARTGVFIGSGIGGFATIEREHEALLKGGPRRSALLHRPRSSTSPRVIDPTTRGRPGPRDRRVLPSHQHGDTDAMICGGSEARSPPGVSLRHAGPSVRATTPRKGLAALRQGPRRLRDREGRHPPAEELEREAGRRSAARSSATACRATPTTSPPPPRTGRRNPRHEGDPRGRGVGPPSSTVNMQYLDPARGATERSPPDGLRRARPPPG